MNEEELLQSAIEQLFNEFLQSSDFAKILKQNSEPLVVSDFNEKLLKKYANSSDKFTADDIQALAYIMGKGDGKIDPSDDSDWTDDMVQEYADNLYNFLYTYKESATQIDPRIDPTEYHRGPMAQDIEKVAPDCVKETDSGAKVVDGNRLALVNAGVIGDLARRLIAIEDKVNG